MSSATMLDALIAALRQAGVYNRDDQTRPAAVLWTDRDRQWEALLPRLRDALPIVTLGEFDPNRHSGPAYWIRYALDAGQIAQPEKDEAATATPIVYLPGVSRPELRAVEDCAPALRAIAELQYRSVFWSHRNGKDWTVPAFLGAADGGLGIEVSGDAATRDALLLVLPLLADVPIKRLRREAPLRAEFFYATANPDEARSILEWLDDPEIFRKGITPEQWQTFVQVATRHYGFSPERDGVVPAAALLGGRDGRWVTVWERFREAPARYPGLPDLLRTARPSTASQLPLFGGASNAECWPQDNDEAEERLRAALRGVDGEGANEARERVAALEAEHGVRRSWVWHALGLAPLASALERLQTLASVTTRAPGGVDVANIAASYAEWGWGADAAVIHTLAAIETQADLQAVTAAIRALYRPWLEAGARALQEAWQVHLPVHFTPITPECKPGTCIVFADGLRLDLARNLEKLLNSSLECEFQWQVGPQPGVTPTAKPAISPVADQLDGGSGFDTVVKSTDTRLSSQGFRTLLAAKDWQVLSGNETGDPAGRAWTEVGAIDSYGHGQGWKLAHHVGSELRTIARRIDELLAAGWDRVVVATDHGWLLLPGGLPKSDLPEHLTEVRKGRCARLKPSATTDEQTVPWYWDETVRVAAARGIAVYVAGSEYEHGGISPQECVIPMLTVTSTSPKHATAIQGATWSGLRCRVAVTDAPAGLVVDLREHVGDAGSSVAVAPKLIDANGIASLVVEDEDREGDSVSIVVCDEAGRVMAQAMTTVGG